MSRRPRRMRPLVQNDDCSAGAKAAGRALEICNRRCRHRRRRDEDRLRICRRTELSNLPGSDQSWRIQVDEPDLRLA